MLHDKFLPEVVLWRSWGRNGTWHLLQTDCWDGLKSLPDPSFCWFFFLSFGLFVFFAEGVIISEPWVWYHRGLQGSYKKGQTKRSNLFQKWSFSEFNHIECNEQFKPHIYTTDPKNKTISYLTIMNFSPFSLGSKRARSMVTCSSTMSFSPSNPTMLSPMR